MKTLALTSPNMKGPEVRAAQKLLEENKFNQDYLEGVIDAEFGPETARACKRAKYWLGYATANMHPTFGQHLEAQLSGDRKLDANQRKRRAQRLQKATETPLRLKALAEARKDIGMTENPANSNICEISKWYGLIGPWCAMGVTKWYVDAGAKHFKRGSRWAYCPYILHDAIVGNFSMALTRNPKPGDILLFDWDNDLVADHTGLLRTEIKSDGTFGTIEGNTSHGNNSNGGKCMERDRTLSDLVTYKGRAAFVHVGE